MAEFDKKTGREVLDDFWDIDKLVPKRKSGLNPFKTSDPVRSFEADLPKNSSDGMAERGEGERVISFSGFKAITNDGGESYEPVAGLIKKVTVTKYSDKYDFYENFRKTALIYYGYKTDRCDFVQFYSYMPQYSQLSKEQRSYYFYWRSEVERERYIKTDYSYLYLYVYEILNLPDKIPPEEGIVILSKLWRAYRKDLPRIDNYFAVWVADYCLVHKLACPSGLIEDFIYEVMPLVSFKELYLSDIPLSGERGTGALLAFLSDYDWRCGRYSEGLPGGGKTGEVLGREDYKKHLYKALEPLLASVRCNISAGDYSTKRATLTRDAFPSLLCTRMVKARLSVEYIPLKGLDDLRRSVSAAVRYTENKLRALMGVKSRIAIRDLPDSFKNIIDAYFDNLAARGRAMAVKRNIPEYERLYDAPAGELSFSSADEIERASWGITERLVADSYPEEEDNHLSMRDDDTVDTEDNGADVSLDEHSLLDVEAMTLLRSVLEKDVQASIELSSAAERINEMFYEVLGDIVLTIGEDSIALVEDYREDIENWLQR